MSEKTNNTPAPPQLEEVKVNNSSLTELKLACDDALRRHLSRPDQFKAQHTHTDVRLGLGYASVAIAAVTGLYSWKKDFEESKPMVWVGVILYMLLTGAQTLYAYFVERDTVFVGKRKTVNKRIETERLTIGAKTLPSNKKNVSTGPRYVLTASYVHTANGGKSLIRKAKQTTEATFTTWFDEEGRMDEVAFGEWLSGFVEKLVGESS
ncbi:Microsomal signal peptidase 25 kDa subunit (SPC25), partial [Rhizoctonia solani]